MDNTGLKNVLEEIYGENVVYHMLQGKAYSRAVRGNLIVAQVLSYYINITRMFVCLFVCPSRYSS